MSVLNTTAADIRYNAAICQISTNTAIVTKELDPVIMDISLA
jgi:hypothetical protein